MRRKIIPYDPKLKTLARDLRNNSTIAEVLLWRQIKNKQIRGYRFLRQRPIDRYIVDFFCYELMLAIEVDGITHDFKAEEDRSRHDRLESLGVHVLRFTDQEVKGNIEGVLTILEKWIDKFEESDGKHPPNPPQGGNSS